MILLPLLLLAALGGGLLAPLVGAHLVLLADRAPGRLAHWLGLTLGLGLIMAVLPLALACAVLGPAAWSPYHAAYGFALATALLGSALVRAHARLLRGDTVDGGRLGLACLAFALALAVALVPWLLGAPLPFAAGEFGAEQPLAGDARAYLAVVAPLALGLAGEAWLLRRLGTLATGTRRTQTATTLALAVLALALPLALPRMGCNPRQAAARERAALRAQAERQDEPRRKALTAILTGNRPALGAAPCPYRLPDWEQLVGFAESATRLADLAVAGAAWDNRRDVAACSSNVALDLHRWSSHLDGPHRRLVAHALDESAWQGPWPERDVLVSPDEARRRVRSRSGLADWEVDATLVIEGETPSFSAYGKSNLGSLDATLWLWSHGQRAFVCGGQAHVPSAVLDEGFDTPQAIIVRNALRMRALALAAGDLRAIERW